jgi:hypothetical protein
MIISEEVYFVSAVNGIMSSDFAHDGKDRILKISLCELQIGAHLSGKDLVSTLQILDGRLLSYIIVCYLGNCSCLERCVAFNARLLGFSLLAIIVFFVH